MRLALIVRRSPGLWELLCYPTGSNLEDWMKNPGDTDEWAIWVPRRIVTVESAREDYGVTIPPKTTG